MEAGSALYLQRITTCDNHCPSFLAACRPMRDTSFGYGTRKCNQRAAFSYCLGMQLVSSSCRIESGSGDFGDWAGKGAKLTADTFHRRGRQCHQIPSNGFSGYLPLSSIAPVAAIPAGVPNERRSSCNLSQGCMSSKVPGMALGARQLIRPTTCAGSESVI